MTDESVRIEGRSYRLRELHDVVVSQQHTTPVLATAIVAAVVFLVAFLLGLGFGRVWAFLVVVAVGGLAIAAWLVVRRPVSYEVWARYRGLEVRLFSTTDQAQLSRITRALKRALEARIAQF